MLGDVNPATTQAGVVTKFRNADDENAADMATNKGDFDPHDHGAASGGQPIGTGPVIAIAPDGIDNAALHTDSVTGAKVQTGAVTTPKIADNTVEREQLGAPKFSTKTAGGTSVNFTFGGVSVLPLFSVEVDPGPSVRLRNYTQKVNSSSSITVGSVNAGDSVTCRAYGTTGIT